MKKSYLWSGLGMIAGGILFLLAALLLDTPLDSLFCGFFGAFTGPSVKQVYKYVRWTKLETPDSYQRHLEEEQIELRDERKSMLRDRSGRYAYVLGMLLACAAIVVFSILGKLGVVPEEAAELLIYFLAAFLLVEFTAGILIYKRLETRY